MASLERQPRFKKLADSVAFRARRKSMYSVMKKMLRLGDMQKGGRRLEEIYDLLGVRAVVQPRQVRRERRRCGNRLMHERT